MTPFDIFMGTALLAVIAFQSWLTMRVFKSGLYERNQKIWQAQLIWLLPIVGAGLVLSILQESQKSEREATAHLKLDSKDRQG